MERELFALLMMQTEKSNRLAGFTAGMWVASCPGHTSVKSKPPPPSLPLDYCDGCNQPAPKLPVPASAIGCESESLQDGSYTLHIVGSLLFPVPA